jgi:ribosomal protein S18 acetylase RimI-like enzyme
LAIKPENQHKGYGSKMIDFITTELKNEGVRLLEVKTLAPGTGYTPYEATRNFYEKSGFMLMDIIDPYPGWEPGNPCALYVKIL